MGYMGTRNKPVFSERDWLNGYLPARLPELQCCLVSPHWSLLSCVNQAVSHQALTSALAHFELKQSVSRQIHHVDIDTTRCWLFPLAHECEEVVAIVVVEPLVHSSVEEMQGHYYNLQLDLTRGRLVATQERLRSADDWIRNELDEIGRLQQLMLPEKSLEIPGIDFAFEYRAMKGAGGDYIDVADLTDADNPGDRQFGIIIADVSGHGPSAAVETAMLDAILRTYEPQSRVPTPAEALDYINKHFFTRKGRGSFMTAIVMHYSEKERLIRYANAGHPPAFLKGKNGITELGEGGIPVGVLRDQTWEDHVVSVEQGDTLFIYTDVVVETVNRNQEAFGFERLQRTLAHSPAKPLEMLAYLEGQMRLFCGCSSYQDDLTTCAIQFLE